MNTKTKNKMGKTECRIDEYNSSQMVTKEKFP